MNYEIHLKDGIVIIANCRGIDNERVGVVYRGLEDVLCFGDVFVSVKEFKYAFPTDKEPCYE